MRILLIHNFYKQAGGEDTVFHAEAALLQGHGHTVEKLALSNNEVNTIGEKLMAALGVVYNYGSARTVENALLRFQPDVVHVHNFFPLVSPAVFYVCQKHRVPVVLTLHNYRLLCPSAVLHYNGKVQLENIHKTFPLRAIAKGIYRNSRIETASVVLTTGIHKMLGTWQHKVDRYIALTPGAADLFLDSSLRLRPEQLAIKPNFTEDLGEGAPDREDAYIYIGRLAPEKGIETLLQAHQLQPFKLRIIGDGPLRGQVERYAANNPSVTYMGFRKREETMQLLKKAKALIFPSEWLETFGMTVIEAFATGTPVIAANLGGAAHLVKDQHNGLHFAPQQPTALTHCVQELELKPNFREELGKNARATYLRHYTPEANYQLLLQVYKDVIRQKKRPAPTTV
ncbi:glycosyltransferase family 4 protein [Pontibacter sp. E15-1]|uniref:glycosyltransferase family 4 protein n=1 Tax=Pontibacter sp. E15-1 TaxID=2919918 RepID=UPI001F4F6D70|nr:glycosyltransferase family 4 protein [Pontibacter sp. E15-1]MCJ8166729.1 glycosyltransferase family 4 protein [Pontibacter sp. E15-1]